VPGVRKVVAAYPDDDVIVECALTGRAACVVTRDRHLIDLAQHGGIPMVRVRFVELDAAGESPTDRSGRS